MSNRLLRGLTGKSTAQRLQPLNPRALGLGLLVTLVAVLSPSAAWAASLTLGERAVIGLFRGAGGLLGALGSDSDPSGIDILASEITTAFPNHNLTVQVFDSYQGNIFFFQEVGSPQGTAFINQFEDVGAVGLIGYSGGGLSAIRTATNQSPQLIDLLVQIDSYEPLTGNSQEDEVLPTNVQVGINYYQRRNRYKFFRSGWDPFDLQGAKTVSGSQNINVEDLFRDRSITHRTIDDDTRLHNRIVQDIATYVLPQITPPSLPTEIIAPDAVPLALSTPSLIASQRLSAEANTAAVPEPSSLLALGAIGSGLWLMRKYRPTS